VIVGIVIDLFIELLTWTIAGIGTCLGEYLFKKWRKAAKAREAAQEAEAEAAKKPAPRRRAPPKRKPKR
jgi:hypothetical protein